MKSLFPYIQYILPTHLLTRLVGFFADSTSPWLKNNFIKSFIKIYKVDMRPAVISNPEAYPTFNDFFIRQLQPELRPIASQPSDIACPVDGTLSQIGRINKNLLLQAKNFYFDLTTVLGGDTELAQSYYDGSFALFYLGPGDYHRYHMPFSGRLTKTIYVPGRLFSVNKITSEIIPHLYSRNERLVCIFDTDIGSMAIILIGALIVGSIQTVWMMQPIRASKIITQTYSDGMQLNKGEELGWFKLGSSVILIFERDKVEWSSQMKAGNKVLFGQCIGKSLSVPDLTI